MLIRRAQSEDGSAVANVRVASWRATYRGIVPDSYLDHMPSNEELWGRIAAGAEPNSELLICEDEGRIVGFASFGAARPPHFDYSGELHATYFLPEATGKGYGRAIMRETVRALTRRGYADMMLWVMEDNLRGRRFYESFGGSQIANSRQSFEIAGRTIFEVGYGFRPLPVTR
ncbi:MAG TPA: GNAT family N-acetyltransferase [Rhizomicrobium sp.]|jgi:ribosomal protein S18 acetylase RimI-like enzyme